MDNPIGHWLRVPFRIRSWIPLRGLSSFRVTPGLLVSAHPRLVPVRRYFGFSMSFFWFQKYWLHSSVVTNQVVFGEIGFISFLPEYVEIILAYYVAYSIKYRVY